MPLFVYYSAAHFYMRSRDLWGNPSAGTNVLANMFCFTYSDAIGGKPWADSSETPMRDFWKANDTWLPTWGPVKDRGMVVKSVKMWQEGAC
jgi:hypothetical protein